MKGTLVLELKCWSPSRSWDAVVRTEIKMLKSKHKLKIYNLFLRGAVGLEGKMNDKRMVSQTPMVHKLDVLSSWCFADCSKYVREWERVSEEESVKKSECALSCWVVFPAARRRKERKWSIMLPGLSCHSQDRKRRERMCTVMLAGLSYC